MKDVFNVKGWKNLSNSKALIKSKNKLLKQIKEKLIQDDDTNKLYKFVISSNMEALQSFESISKNKFINELITFIYYVLYTHIKYPTYSDEELIHFALFDDATTDDTRNVKILCDVGWHCQPYEGYAETVAKLVGLIYDPNGQKMLFDKLRNRSLANSWLPGLEYYDKLISDLVLQCQVDGKRSCKTDKRSNKESITFKNMKEKDVANKLPYCMSLSFFFVLEWFHLNILLFILNLQFQSFVASFEIYIRSKFCARIIS